MATVAPRRQKTKQEMWEHGLILRCLKAKEWPRELRAPPARHVLQSPQAHLHDHEMCPYLAFEIGTSYNMSLLIIKIMKAPLTRNSRHWQLQEGNGCAGLREINLWLVLTQVIAQK
jgi:hypothetical protein